MASTDEDNTNPLVEQLLPVNNLEAYNENGEVDDEPDWKHLRIVGGELYTFTGMIQYVLTVPLNSSPLSRRHKWVNLG